jgi:hypothetical protein
MRSTFIVLICVLLCGVGTHADNDESPQALWERVFQRVSSQSRSARLLLAASSRVDFSVTNNYLKLQPHLHWGGTGFIDGVSARDMTRPVMWGVDPNGRLFLAVRTTCEVELLGAAQVPPQVSREHDDFFTSFWNREMPPHDDDHHIQTYFTRHTSADETTNSNNSDCMKVNSDCMKVNSDCMKVNSDCMKVNSDCDESAHLW